jgi:hypothetical protein
MLDAVLILDQSNILDLSFHFQVKYDL